MIAVLYFDLKCFTISELTDDTLIFFENNFSNPVDKPVETVNK